MAPCDPLDRRRERRSAMGLGFPPCLGETSLRVVLAEAQWSLGLAELVHSGLLF